MSAFESYARYYDLLYRDKDYAGEARWIDSLLREAGIREATMLDIGCGTGAHAREFARLGWNPAGVDLSEQMIEIARARTPGEWEIEYHNGAAATFTLGRTFAAIVSLFHVASYQSGTGEAFRMFANVRRHLAPGGLFFFDFWHGPGVLMDPPAVRVRRVEDDRTRVTRISEPAHHTVDCRIDVAYEVLIEEKETMRVERLRELHRMRYFFRPELELMLEHAGFRVERFGGGLGEKELEERDWYGAVLARAV